MFTPLNFHDQQKTVAHSFKIEVIKFNDTLYPHIPKENLK